MSKYIISLLSQLASLRPATNLGGEAISFEIASFSNQISNDFLKKFASCIFRGFSRYLTCPYFFSAGKSNDFPLTFTIGNRGKEVF